MATPSRIEWPKLLSCAGLVLFSIACVDERLPEWTLYIGPAVMLAGVLMMIGKPDAPGK
jgi:hypothetical protein